MKSKFKFQGTRGRPLSKGLLGHADPVAWAAMLDVMEKVADAKAYNRAYAEARRLGRVGTSLALCRDLRTAEAAASDAVDVCRRVAGDQAALAAINVGNVEVKEA